jgi:hypothetical protein
MTAHTITHTEFTAEYWAGFEAKAQEIKSMGWQAARDKFNLDNPIGANMSMAGFYFAKGEMQALAEAM